MGKGPKAHQLVPNPHSLAVFPPCDRTFCEQVEERRKHQNASSPTTATVRAAPDCQAPPTTGWQRSTDLIEVASSTHSQLTA